jgi:hypothetical protein
MYGMSEIRYVTLTDEVNPLLLARVRWPDVAEAITIGRCEWQTDPGLFDLPYDPHGVPVSREQAEQIAGDWGAVLPDGPSSSGSGPCLIRRMPANWSSLTTAERKAWSLELGRIRKSNRRRHARRAASRTRGPLGVLRALSRRSASTPEPQDAGDELEEELSAPGDLFEGLLPIGPAPVPSAEMDTTDSASSDGEAAGDPAGAPYANLNDPRLTGLRLPVGGAQVSPASAPDPTSPARPSPGVR